MARFLALAFLVLLSTNAIASTGIVWRNLHNGQHWLHKFDSYQHTGSYSLSNITDQNWQLAAHGDFNGDGTTDLLWRHQLTGINWLYTTDGNAVVTSQQLNQVSDSNWRIVATGDFDGDKDDDILWRHQKTGQNWLYKMNQGHIDSAIPLNTVSDLNWQIAGVADFNGDGYDDILWQHQQTGILWIYGIINGAVRHSAFLKQVGDLNWKIAAVADLNGDLIGDIVWHHQTSGDTYLYSISNYEVAAQQRINRVSTEWTIAAVNDFNNDHKADLLWRHSSGQLWLYLMDGATIQNSQALPVNVSENWFPIAALESLTDNSNSWRIPLKITEFDGTARTQEMIQNGLPIARQLNILDIETLQIIDENEQPVTTQFEVLSRWAGGKNSERPIQWLLVTFPASVDALQQKTVYLTLKQSTDTAVTSEQLQLTENDDSITVNTGAATFAISKKRFSVLESAFNNKSNSDIVNASLSAGKGYSQLIVNYAGNSDPIQMTAMPPSEVKITRQGINSATIKVAGNYDNPPSQGGVNLRYVAHYTFFANSNEFELDFYYAWPGSGQGYSTNSSSLSTGWTMDEQRSASLLIEKASLSIPLLLSPPFDLFAQAENNVLLTSTQNTTGQASLVQYRRNGMQDPPSYKIQIDDHMTTGASATQPFIGITGESGGIGVSLRQMALYEPQSLESTSKDLTINIVNEPQWLGPFMGAFSSMRFRLFEENLSEPEIQESIAAIQTPVMAWPDTTYVSQTQCFDELWDGTESPLADGLMARVRGMSDLTFSDVQLLGMYGMMTYGLSPRSFEGSTQYSYNEFGGTAADTEWDGYFFGGTFTDYHNTYTSPTYLFALTGESKYLYQLSYPAARRTLHTQIVQHQPGYEGAYSGWAPAGYGGYRRDFNSSHSYFDNLFYYYYLTGDQSVLETLAPTGKTLRSWYTRKDNQLLPADAPTPVNFVSSTGRVGSQMAEILFFLGHASDDAGYLDDYLNLNDRAITRHMALLTSPSHPDKEFAFLSSQDIYDSTGSFTTGQFWMETNYTMYYLWQIYSEYGDREMGIHKLPISRIFKAYHNSLWSYAATIHFSGEGDGTPQGKWANSATVYHDGNLVGGRITDVASQTEGESYIWDSNKLAIATLSLRASAMNNYDQAIYDAGKSMYIWKFGNSSFSLAKARLNKIAGLEFKSAFQALSYLVNRDH